MRIAADSQSLALFLKQLKAPELEVAKARDVGKLRRPADETGGCYCSPAVISCVCRREASTSRASVTAAEMRARRTTNGPARHALLPWTILDRLSVLRRSKGRESIGRLSARPRFLIELVLPGND